MAINCERSHLNAIFDTIKVVSLKNFSVVEPWALESNQKERLGTQRWWLFDPVFYGLRGRKKNKRTDGMISPLVCVHAFRLRTITSADCHKTWYESYAISKPH